MVKKGRININLPQEAIQFLLKNKRETGRSCSYMIEKSLYHYCSEKGLIKRGGPKK
jgi:hypothetical protein